jgi:protein-L-isoaspartate(D-aspartate) O-methyltransferase
MNNSNQLFLQPKPATTPTLLKTFFILILSLCSSMLFSEHSGASSEEKDYMQKRQQMVRLIEEDVRQTSQYLDKENLDPKVMQAILEVPRHKFVSPDTVDYAYRNSPLPIGYGQTISQPYIVAIMTDLLKLTKDSQVLEIGTGSGYQAAILSQLVQQVYSLEIITPLSIQAQQRFVQLGYNNITAQVADGYYGWKEYAPFDAIIVTAAASHIPHPLIKQLKPGGRMIIPVGSQFVTQQLLLIEKTNEGELLTRQLLPVRFVPLTGKH